MIVGGRVLVVVILKSDDLFSGSVVLVLSVLLSVELRSAFLRSEATPGVQKLLVLVDLEVLEVEVISDESILVGVGVWCVSAEIGD